MDSSKESISTLKKHRENIDQVRELLEQPFWPETIQSNERYFITHDDNGGDRSKGLEVAISVDGDVWIDTTCLNPFEACRFRTHAGGGRNQRVRNALLILAEAIRLDNEGPVPY